MAEKVSDRVQQQPRTAPLETEHIDSEKRAYEDVRSDYAAMLNKYNDATEQELIRSTWLYYIKEAMHAIDGIYNQIKYNKLKWLIQNSSPSSSASSSSKTSSEGMRKRERTDLSNDEMGTTKRKYVETASMSEEATYNIAKFVKTNGCVSTDDDRSECGDGGGYDSIEGGNSIYKCEGPQQMSRPFRTSTPKSSATFRQREDIVAKQHEHIGRAQSDQSSECDLYGTATNDNTIYEDYLVDNVVNTDASVTTTAATTVATNFSSSAVSPPLSPKHLSCVNDNNRSHDSQTTKDSYAMRVRWNYVKSWNADYQFAPNDHFAFVKGNGTVATIRYDSSEKSLNVVGDSRQIAFRKTVSQRFAAKAFKAFEMLAYLKMGKVIGKHIVILAYDFDKQMYKRIVDLLRQSELHSVKEMKVCRGLKHKDIQQAIGDGGGVIFCQANTRSFVGFRKAYNRILGSASRAPEMEK